jgi:hypothetical protein
MVEKKEPIKKRKEKLKSIELTRQTSNLGHKTEINLMKCNP